MREGLKFTGLIQLGRHLGAGGHAATEGQCCSRAGPRRESGEQEQHVCFTCDVSVQSSVNNLTDNMLLCPVFFLSPSWFCLLSFPSPLTVKQTRPPGRCPHRSSSSSLAFCLTVVTESSATWGRAVTWFRINPQISESPSALSWCFTDGG